MKHNYAGSYGDVKLVPLSENDIEQLRHWRNNPKNSQFIRKIPFIDKDAQRAWFESYLSNEDEIAFAIYRNSCLMGSVSLYDLNNETITFGKLMVGTGRGSGIGFAATQVILSIAFEALNQEAVQAEVSVDNTAALIIYVRIGFLITGRRYNDMAQMDEFTLRIDRERYYRLNK